MKKIMQAKKNDDEELVAEMKLQAENANDKNETKLNLRNVGVHEFFIAQKAGRRMREFAKRWRETKIMKEEADARANARRKEEGKDRNIEVIGMLSPKSFKESLSNSTKEKTG